MMPGGRPEGPVLNRNDDRHLMSCREIRGARRGFAHNVGPEDGCLHQVSNDVADADHADQRMILQNRQQPHLVLIHQLQDGVGGVVRRATDERPIDKVRDR